MKLLNRKNYIKMKRNKLLTALIYATAIILLFSCAPGRWVGGNAKHTQQRYDAKQKSLTIKN